MKNMAKLFGIIALVALIGFSMTACDDEGTSSPAGGGGGGGLPTITIQNNTGYGINGIWIKPSTSTTWGSNLWGWQSLPAGQSRTFAIPQLLLAQGGHDVRLSQQSNGTGHNFRRYGLTLTSGMTLTFTTADFVAGTSHHQSITIQNRSGVNFASVHIKPSASPEWDTNSFGTLSNNSNMSASVPIPPSNFSVFDIQARSVNPANTYTINNVTVSDGTTVLFTSANADNPPMGFPVIVIQNNTGYGINGIWIRTSTSTDWGSNLWGWQSLTAGQSRTFTLPQLLTAQSLYDIRLSQQSNGTGHNFIRSNITMTEGIVVTLTVSDLSQ